MRPRNGLDIKVNQLTCLEVRADRIRHRFNRGTPVENLINFNDTICAKMIIRKLNTWDFKEVNYFNPWKLQTSFEAKNTLNL